MCIIEYKGHQMGAGTQLPQTGEFSVHFLLMAPSYDIHILLGTKQIFISN